jgi:DNA gyrase subunit B
MSPLKEVSETDETGTSVRFFPDSEIFPERNFNRDMITTRVRDLAYLNKGLVFHLVDEEKADEHNYHFEGGIADFVRSLNKNKEVLHETPIYISEKRDEIIIELSFQYHTSYVDNILSFVNNIHTQEGGTHETGFKIALTRAINDCGRRYGFIKENEENLTGDDVREGLTAVLSIKMKDPQFEGQTKTKLGNGEVRGIVDSAVNEHLSTFFEENPSVAKMISEKAVKASPRSPLPAR